MVRHQSLFSHKQLDTHLDCETVNERFEISGIVVPRSTIGCLWN